MGHQEVFLGDTRALILIFSSDLPQECLYSGECRKTSREAFSGGEKAGGRRSREDSGWVSGHRSRGEISVWGTRSPGSAGHCEESGSSEFSGAPATEGFGAWGAVTHMGLSTIPLATVGPLGHYGCEPGERWGGPAPGSSTGGWREQVT